MYRTVAELMRDIIGMNEQYQQTVKWKCPNYSKAFEDLVLSCQAAKNNATPNWAIAKNNMLDILEKFFAQWETEFSQGKPAEEYQALSKVFDKIHEITLEERQSYERSRSWFSSSRASDPLLKARALKRATETKDALATQESEGQVSLRQEIRLQDMHLSPRTTELNGRQAGERVKATRCIIQ